MTTNDPTNDPASTTNDPTNEPPSAQRVASVILAELMRLDRSAAEGKEKSPVLRAPFSLEFVGLVADARMSPIWDRALVHVASGTPGAWYDVEGKALDLNNPRLLEQVTQRLQQKWDSVFTFFGGRPRSVFSTPMMFKLTIGSGITNEVFMTRVLRPADPTYQDQMYVSEWQGVMVASPRRVPPCGEGCFPRMDVFHRERMEPPPAQPTSILDVLMDPDAMMKAAMGIGAGVAAALEKMEQKQQQRRRNSERTRHGLVSLMMAVRWHDAMTDPEPGGIAIPQSQAERSRRMLLKTLEEAMEAYDTFMNPARSVGLYDQPPEEVVGVAVGTR